MPTDPDRAAPPTTSGIVASRTGQLADSAHRSAASFELAFAPVLLALVGLWLDRTLGTTPFLVVGLAVLGVLGVGVKIYYQYRHHMATLQSSAPWADRTVDRLAERESAA